MTAPGSTATPLWFRIAAVVALVWNAFGCVMFLSAAGAFGDPTAGLSEAERAIAANIPGWIMAAFGVGTFAGLAGSMGLVLRPALGLAAARRVARRLARARRLHPVLQRRGCRLRCGYSDHRGRGRTAARMAGAPRQRARLAALVTSLSRAQRCPAVLRHNGSCELVAASAESCAVLYSDAAYADGFKLSHFAP